MIKGKVLLMVLALILLSSLIVIAGAHLEIDHEPPEEFYANDEVGKVFQSSIRSAGSEAARDVHIELMIPEGFTFRQDTLEVKVKDNDDSRIIPPEDMGIVVDGQKVTITFNGLNPHELEPVAENVGGVGGAHGEAASFVFVGATERMRVGQTAHLTLQAHHQPNDIVS